MINLTPHYQGLNVTFQVTEDCNLRCKYCYEVDKQPKDLPLEYATKFIDHLLDDPDPINATGNDREWILDQGLVLDFIGGDALMRPDLCDEILKYFIFSSQIKKHKWANRWRSSLSSNGTLLGEPAVRRFLEKYKANLSLGISVDGCPEIHNLNRSGSMNALLDNWQYYQASGFTFRLGTKATCNKDSIPYLAESIRYLHETMQIQEIAINFIFENMYLTDEDYIEIDRQFSLMVDYIYEHRDDLYVGFFDKGILAPGHMTLEERLNAGWCGAGAMPTVTVNGFIYPCFRFCPNTMCDRSYDMSVGDVWNGFNKKENFECVRQQTRKQISPSKCLECPIDHGCAWCIGGAFSEKGEFFRTTNLCKVNQLRNKWATKYWQKVGLDTIVDSIELSQHNFVQNFSQEVLNVLR